MDLVDQIAEAVKEPGKKSALAKALGKHPNVVTNILKGDRKIGLEEAPIIRRFLGLDANEVPVRGSVGAGDEFYAFNADDPNEMVPGIPEGGPDTVAVEIRGTSLGPAFNGWLAYYDDRREPLTEDLLGQLCIVGLDDGRVLIKIPRQARQKGTYHLFPNSGGDVILDAKVAWAARVIDMRPKP